MFFGAEGGNMKRIWRKARRGFTLIELMIVVAIIGILAAAAVPNFVDATDEARIARIQSDLSVIGSAVEIYHAKNGKYPSSLSELVSDQADGSGGYLRSEPKPPVDGDSYGEPNPSTGEVIYTFNDVTYSSFGTNTKDEG